MLLSGWVPLVPVCLCTFKSRLSQCTIKCPLHIHIKRTNTAQGRAPQRSQKFRVGENLQINRHCWPGQIRVVFLVSLFVHFLLKIGHQGWCGETCIFVLLLLVDQNLY